VSDMYTTLFGDGHRIVGEFMPDLVVPPTMNVPIPPAPEVVQGFRLRPYRQTWIVPQSLPVPTGGPEEVEIDWCEGPYRGVR
jgi:hypothetical protein